MSKASKSKKNGRKAIKNARVDDKDAKRERNSREGLYSLSY